MELDAGTHIDKYEVIAFLGEGGMARVYRVRHRELDAIYALKVLQARSRSIKERLLREGKVQASLRHRNIVSVTDTVTIDGQPGLVMEFIDGMDLDELILKEHPLPLDEVASIGKGIIRGVRAAHKAGHLHRDLKPANVMMVREDDEWVPKVADFGLAKVLEGPQGGVAATRSGQLMGSPAYMSPEQARDAKNVDARTDVFAIGCILYELATGERTFDGPDVLSTMARIAAGAYKPVDQLRPDLLPHQVAAIHGSLVVDRDQRIPDCETLLAVWTGRATFEVPSNDAGNTLGALFGETMDVPDGLKKLVEQASYDTLPQADPQETVLRGPSAASSAETVLVIEPAEAEEAAPAKRGRLVLGLFGVSAAGVGAVGLLGVAAVAGWALWPGATSPPKEPASDVAGPTAPLDSDPAGDIDPVRGDEPVEPAPVRPEPTPEQPPPTPDPGLPEPEPRPDPIATAPEPPPNPAPPPLPMGEVRLHPESVPWVDLVPIGNGPALRPGEVPPGTYMIHAAFAAGEAKTATPQKVVVTNGSVWEITCRSKFGRCSPPARVQ